MGKVKKGQLCSIVNCNERAVRSLSSSEALNYLSKLNLKVKDSNSRRIYLCEKHYKMYKKASKKNRMFEKWWRGL
ncbi:MAG: hypothetical protein DRJ21_01630 [Candidatus Methanomethylicota archaeon]|uniref:Uncharacterized protein n=1 Tax=Thermoproteota archaeon TaxID=2056631 RepID=A0A497ET65_9CREN|nr:MAG: hypothetical protein DRJ21_01630 [Candidatus Verstraetearchaeota archaeon]